MEHRSFKKVSRTVNVVLLVLALILWMLVWNGVLPAWTGIVALVVVLAWSGFGLILEIRDSTRKGT